MLNFGKFQTGRTSFIIEAPVFNTYNSVCPKVPAIIVALARDKKAKNRVIPFELKFTIHIAL
jgi:hypothetical protein